MSIRTDTCTQCNGAGELKQVTHLPQGQQVTHIPCWHCQPDQSQTSNASQYGFGSAPHPPRPASLSPVPRTPARPVPRELEVGGGKSVVQALGRRIHLRLLAELDPPGYLREKTKAAVEEVARINYHALSTLARTLEATDSLQLQRPLLSPQDYALLRHNYIHQVLQILAAAGGTIARELQRDFDQLGPGSFPGGPSDNVIDGHYEYFD